MTKLLTAEAAALLLCVMLGSRRAMQGALTHSQRGLILPVERGDLAFR